MDREERIKIIKSCIEKLEKQLDRLKRRVNDLERGETEQDDGSWYSNHGHGD